MSNLAWRHVHVCPDCERSWECFVPGGCRDDRERTCGVCEDEEEDGDEEGDDEA